MAGPVTAHLRELADDELYRRNAFRITGLATDAGPRALRERQKKAAAAAAVGVAVPTDERMPLPVPPADDEVRAAYDVLADPRRRLVHELFWFWGEDTTACGCRSHEGHDDAVEAHALALDAEPAGDRGDTWTTARDGWEAVLHDPATWSHLRARVATLDDPRRLDGSAVDDLRAEAPRALVATVVSLAVHSDTSLSHRTFAERWPVDAADLDDLLLEAVAGRVATVEARLTEARERVRTDPLGAARLLRPDVVDDLAWIETLAPHERLRPVAALRDEAAIALNNAALGIVERGRMDDRDEALTVYADALALATTSATRTTIVANRDGTRDAPDPAATALYEELNSALRRGHYTRASALATELLGMVKDREERAQLRSIARDAARLAGTTPRGALRSAGTPSPMDRVRSVVAVGLFLALIVGGIFGVASLIFTDPRWLIFVGTGLSVVAVVVLLRRAANRDLDEP